MSHKIGGSSELLLCTFSQWFFTLLIFVLRCDPRNIFASVFSFTMTICKQLTNRRIIILTFWLLGNGWLMAFFMWFLWKWILNTREKIQSLPNIESVSSNGCSGSFDGGKLLMWNEWDVNKVAHWWESNSKTFLYLASQFAKARKGFFCLCVRMFIEMHLLGFEKCFMGFGAEVQGREFRHEQLHWLL